jgi:hypothetical protein
MKRPDLWPRTSLVCAIALTSTVACTDPGEAASGRAPIVADATQPDFNAPPTHPSDVIVASDAFLRVTGPGGGDVVADVDGSYRLEVRAGGVDSLRTVAFQADVTGASVVAWERVDDLLKSTGGTVIPLSSELAGSRLSIIAGTTQVVSDETATGAVLATLRVQPTADQVAVTLRAEGNDLGFIDGAGQRLQVTTTDAAFARSGS